MMFEKQQKASGEKVHLSDTTEGQSSDDNDNVNLKITSNDDKDRQVGEREKIINPNTNNGGSISQNCQPAKRSKNSHIPDSLASK